MAAMTALAGVGLVLGAGTAIAGGIGASKAKKKQEEHLAEMNAIARQKLAFAKEVYSDWQKSYGPINTQLSAHYANLSAEGVKRQYELANTEAVNALQKNLDNTRAQLESTFRKQGMANSGAAVAAQMQLDAQGMSQRAGLNFATEMAKANAGREVAAEKMGFYNMGLAEKQMGLGLVEGAHNAQLGVKQAGIQIAAEHGKAMMGLANAGMRMVGSALGGLAGSAGGGAAGGTAASVPTSGATPAPSIYNGLRTPTNSLGAYDSPKLLSSGIPSFIEVNNSYMNDVRSNLFKRRW